MFVNFKRPVIKRVRWMKRSVIVKSIACRSTQFPFIRLTLLLRAVLAKRVVCPLSVCRWKQSVISAATSDILASNALREAAFSTNARKNIFPVFVCLNLKNQHQQQPSLSAAAPVNSGDDKVNVFTLVNGVLANCLIDTGAKRNHIDKAFINRTNLSVNNSTKEEIGLAVKGSTVRTRGSCNVQIDLLDRSYEKVNMLAMDNLWDVLLGREFLR